MFLFQSLFKLFYLRVSVLRVLKLFGFVWYRTVYVGGDVGDWRGGRGASIGRGGDVTQFRLLQC